MYDKKNVQMSIFVISYFSYVRFHANFVQTTQTDVMQKSRKKALFEMNHKLPYFPRKSFYHEK